MENNFKNLCDNCIHFDICSLRASISNAKDHVHGVISDIKVRRRLVGEFGAITTINVNKCKYYIPAIETVDCRDVELVAELKEAGYTEEQINNAKYVVRAQKEVILV